jgi:hypothetical protein
MENPGTAMRGVAGPRKVPGWADAVNEVRKPRYRRGRTRCCKAAFLAGIARINHKTSLFPVYQKPRADITMTAAR